MRSASLLGAIYAPDFEEFWQLTPTPRRIDKKRAGEEYAKARVRASKDEIHRGYALYWQCVADREPQFTKHPCTWLRGDCWADEAYQQPIAAIVVAPTERRINIARAALRDAALKRMH